jgi:hypothetical protein
VDVERVTGPEAASVVRAALVPSFTADRECLAALDTGAPATLFTGSTGSAENLIRIYRRRLAHLARIGLGSVGGEDLLGRLASASGRLSLAQVETKTRWFVVFLDAGTVAGCLGVDRQSDRPPWDDPIG